MSTNNQTNNLNILLPLVLLIALGLGLARFLSELPEQLELRKLKVTYPSGYQFKNFDRLLQKHVKFGLLDYQTVKKDPEIEAAYNELKSTSPQELKGKLEQLCFWLNAYNFLVIKNVLSHYPSDTDKRSSNAKFIIGAKLYSLTKIKDEILPPLIKTTNWKAVFLICNGDLSAPQLAPHAYAPSTVSEDIEAAFKNFVLSPRNYWVNVKEKDFSISPFYLWNIKYFNDGYSSPFEMVNENFPRGEQLNLDAVTRSFSMPYDRRINDFAFYKEARDLAIKAEQEEAKVNKEIEQETQKHLKQQIQELDLTSP